MTKYLVKYTFLPYLSSVKEKKGLNFEKGLAEINAEDKYEARKQVLKHLEDQYKQISVDEVIPLISIANGWEAEN
jgi:hypothetical protein